MPFRRPRYNPHDSRAVPSRGGKRDGSIGARSAWAPSPGAPLTDAPVSAPPSGPTLSAGSESLDQTVRTLGTGTAALVLSTIAFVFLGFLARVTIARYVTLAQWGEFSLGLALSSLLAIVIALGLPSAVSRALSYEHEAAERRRIVRITLLASLLSALAGSVAVFLGAPVLASVFHDAGLTVVFELFAPAIGFTVVSTILAAYFQGVERVGPNAVFNMALNPALFLAFLLAALVLRTGFFGILIAYCVSTGAACAALGLYSWWRLGHALAHPPRAGASDPSGRVSLLLMTVTLFGAASLNLLTQFADTLILGVFRTTSVVGLYAASMTLARLFLAGASSLVYIYLPVSTRLRRDRDFDGLRSTYVTTARWVTVITLPIFCVFFFDPGPTLGFVFGSTYESGVLALRILSVAGFLSVVIGPANAALSGLGHPGANMASAGVSLGLNIGLSVALIPTYGLLGAALAWSIARLAYTGLCLAFIWRTYGMTPFAPTFVRPILAGLAILIPLFVLVPIAPSHYFLLVALTLVALVICLLCVPLTRSVERADLVLYHSVTRATGLRIAVLDRFLESRVAVGTTRAPATAATARIGSAVFATEVRAEPSRPSAEGGQEVAPARWG
jgi:O-antigen/teichoic acid export membrane protein